MLCGELCINCHEPRLTNCQRLYIVSRTYLPIECINFSVRSTLTEANVLALLLGTISGELTMLNPTSTMEYLMLGICLFFGIGYGGAILYGMLRKSSDQKD